MKSAIDAQLFSPAPESAKLVLTYPSAAHLWAVAFHDILRHLGIDVVARPYLYPVANGSLDLGETVGAFEHDGARRVFAFLEESDRDVSSSTYAQHEPGDHLIQLGAEAPESVDNALSVFDPDVPRWSEMIDLLTSLGAGEFNAEARRELAASDMKAAIDEIATRAKRGDPEALSSLAASNDAMWRHTPLLSCRVAGKLTGMRAHTQAITLLRELSDRFPDSVRVRQLTALHYRRSGDFVEAQNALSTLYEDGWRDPETLGILAATWRERHSKSFNRAHLDKSRELYSAAFRATPTDFYAGVNAASTTALLGQIDDARAIAAEVEKVLLTRDRRFVQDDYWSEASLAEVLLLRAEYEKASQQYRKAVALAPNDIGSHESTWIQAQRLMEALGANASEQALIASVFSQIGPVMEPAMERRLAVVMYGGVSLAIYIYGVSKELLNLVRATANVTGRETTQPAAFLTSTAPVYRKLARLIDNPRQSSIVDGSDYTPIRTRFVIDTISGTSAGGINGIFLAKALANDQSIDALRDLWVKESAIDRLLDESPEPASLLDGDKMYRILVKALEDMDAQPSGDSRLHCAEELDLFVTATDLHGHVLGVPLVFGAPKEKRHRSVFRFRSTRNDGPSDFMRDDNPFLAFAARSTSAFPFAFKPMRLEDIDRLLPGIGRYGALSHRELQNYLSASPRWVRFYEDYLDSDGAPGEPAAGLFRERSFGDGGYLDNKPFSHAIRSLSGRRADGAVRRNLLYVEPSPEFIGGAATGYDEVDVVKNVKSALLTLPRYETIREDALSVKERNDLVDDLRRTTAGIESDVGAWNKASETNARDPNLVAAAGDDWKERDLEDMIGIKGAAYGSYHRMKVEHVSGELADIVSAALDLRATAPEAAAVRAIVGSWREARFAAFRESGKRTENALLVDFDFAYRIRRLQFILSTMEGLLRGDELLLTALWRDTDDSTTTDRVERDPDALRCAVLELKPAVNALLEALESLRRSLLTRSSSDRALTAHHALREALGTLSTPDSGESIAAIAAATEPSSRATLAKRFVQDYDNDVTALADALAKVLHDAFDAASNGFQRTVYPGRTPRTLLNDVEYATRELLWKRYQFFEDYDQIAFPALSRDAIGEAAPVEIHRFGPADEEAKKKLAGTGLAHFGGFLKREWRENDILQGRLQATERIFEMFLPGQSALYQPLLEEAKQIICREERSRESSNCGEVEVDRSLDPTSTARLIAKSTQVVGRIFEKLPESYNVSRKPAFWATRIGRWLAGVVEVSVPGTLPQQFFRHWLKLAYVLTLMLFVLSTILKATDVQWVAILGFGATWLADQGTRVLSQYLDRRQRYERWERWRSAAKIAGYAAVAVLALFGLRTVMGELLASVQSDGNLALALSRVQLAALAAATGILSLKVVSHFFVQTGGMSRLSKTAVTLIKVGFVVLVGVACIGAGAFLADMSWSAWLAELWRAPPFAISE